MFIIWYILLYNCIWIKFTFWLFFNFGHYFLCLEAFFNLIFTSLNMMWKLFLRLCLDSLDSLYFCWYALLMISFFLCFVHFDCEFPSELLLGILWGLGWRRLPSEKFCIYFCEVTKTLPVQNFPFYIHGLRFFCYQVMWIWGLNVHSSNS